MATQSVDQTRNPVSLVNNDFVLFVPFVVPKLK